MTMFIQILISFFFTFIPESLDFLFSGLYIWVSISLNLARFVVIRNIEQVPTTNTRIQRSKKYQRVSFAVIVALSVAYGIMSLKCSKIAYPIVTCILQLSVSGLPWLFSLALNVLMVLLVINIIYKRYQNKAIRFRDTSEATGIDTGSRDNITDKLLQQVAYSMIFQVSFMAIPYTFIVTMHFLSTNCLLKLVKLQEHETIYCIIQSMVPLLNPIALGLFLKQKRDMLASFLYIKNISDCFTTSQKIIPISDDSLQAIHELDETDIQKSYVPAQINISAISTVSNPRVISVQQCIETTMVENITDNMSVVSQKSSTSLSQNHSHRYSSVFIRNNLSITSMTSVTSSISVLSKSSTIQDTYSITNRRFCISK